MKKSAAAVTFILISLLVSCGPKDYEIVSDVSTREFAIQGGGNQTVFQATINFVTQEFIPLGTMPPKPSQYSTDIRIKNLRSGESRIETLTIRCNDGYRSWTYTLGDSGWLLPNDSKSYGTVNSSFYNFDYATIGFEGTYYTR
jgi:hypothetical protein